MLERLAGAIVSQLADYYAGDTMDGLWFCVPFQADQELARNIISLLISAFHRGDLDEALGVAGRWYVRPSKWGLHQWRRERMFADDITIIALSPGEESK